MPSNARKWSLIGTIPPKYRELWPTFDTLLRYIDDKLASIAGLTWTAITGKPTTFPPAAHSHPTSDVTGLSEAIDDRVALLLVPGAHITLTYDDTANELEIAADAAPPRIFGATWGSSAALVAANCKDVYVRVPVACTIVAAHVLTQGGTGSCVIDVRKDTYTNFPPTGADGIAASAKPTVTAGVKATDTTLTGWTTAIAAGDVLAFHVDSTSTFTGISVILDVETA